MRLPALAHGILVIVVSLVVSVAGTKLLAPSVGSTAPPEGFGSAAKRWLVLPGLQLLSPLIFLGCCLWSAPSVIRGWREDRRRCRLYSASILPGSAKTVGGP
jgi:hypothetical protein